LTRVAGRAKVSSESKFEKAKAGQRLGKGWAKEAFKIEA
jgi:hypothetical protein